MHHYSFCPIDLTLTNNTGPADAVFLLHAGATLRNVIIGKNQAEGVHCKGHCTLEVGLTKNLAFQPQLM